MVDEHDQEAWTEYHVDFMPDVLRGGFNGGIGGYVSQRRTCNQLKACAPRTDEELIPLLCDLLVVTSSQTHDLLRWHLDRKVILMTVRKEFFNGAVSLGFFDGTVQKRFDDTNIYRIEYSDGDVEDYTIDELLQLLQCTDGQRREIEQCHADLVEVLEESKADFPREYLFRNKLLSKYKTIPGAKWFGPSLRARRQLSVSLMNFCIFNHTVDECECDKGVDPWARATRAKPCVFRHDPSMCKCHLSAIKMSQDECSYAAYMLQKREWRVQGQHKLQKKSPGPPLMISMYASFEFGPGFKISADTLAQVNRLRVNEKYMEVQDGKLIPKKALFYYPESDDITVAVMQPGENKDGTCVIDIK